MIENLKKYKNGILPWIGIIVLLYTMTLLQIPMVIRNIFLVLSTGYFLYVLWADNRDTKWEVAVLLLGLLVRIVFSYLDVYTEFQLPLGGGDDGIAFMRTAVEYYHGDFSVQYTKYPYVLYAIFKITGINQYAAQYINILCWAFTALLLQKTCKSLDLKGIFRIIVIAVTSWLPTNIWITSILYRDVYVMLFLFLSFYCLLCWMQEGTYKNIVCSVVAVLIATWFHGGTIINLLPIVVVLVFYSRLEQRFCFTKKNVTFCLGCLGFLGVLFIIPMTRNVLLDRIPTIEYVNRWLAMKYNYSEGAGSNYMEGRYLKGYFDILVMTVQKVYYHMFSPVPHMWRGVVDAAAFFLSSAPVYLITTILWCGSFWYKKIDALRFVMFMECFVSIGIYAWGNVNGGTALRHREKILGLMMLLMVYSLSIIINKRKEKKYNEQIKPN